MKIKRIVLKLSGEALGTSNEAIFAKEKLEYIVNEIMQLKTLGIEVAIMVGGGNILRGKTFDFWDTSRAEKDSVGTMATVINACVLKMALQSLTDSDVRIMTATPMHAVGEEYCRERAISHLQKNRIVIFAGGNGQPFVSTDYPTIQRACEIDADAVFMAKNGINGVFKENPKENPDARIYKTLSYSDAIANSLEVIDFTGFILAKQFNCTLHIYNFEDKGAAQRICLGETVGTMVSNGVTSELYEI